jgi:uncharacterized protein YehS (DUF1456 family)
MTNNDVLRRLRYTFDFSDDKVISIFASADLEVTRNEISNWLKKDDDPAFENLSDKKLATFLNGFINDQRGKREGEQPVPESKLSNNIIFRKIKIALNLEADDVLEILGLEGFRLSNHELSALFRKKGHKHYRECKDQILRNFLQGLQHKVRDNKE